MKTGIYLLSIINNIILINLSYLNIRSIDKHLFFEETLKKPKAM